MSEQRGIKVIKHGVGLSGSRSFDVTRRPDDAKQAEMDSRLEMAVLKMYVRKYPKYAKELVQKLAA
jgi:hypothetical protein